jgi:hypothetical protein
MTATNRSTKPTAEAVTTVASRLEPSPGAAGSTLPDPGSEGTPG